MINRIKGNPLLWKFTKFCLVGGVGFLIAYSLLWILTEKAGMWYMFSALIAQVAATLWNFWANLKWTFVK
jgi:putative flippase GtrA